MDDRKHMVAVPDATPEVIKQVKKEPSENEASGLVKSNNNMNTEVVYNVKYKKKSSNYLQFKIN
jgi:hypothetical protein